MNTRETPEKRKGSAGPADGRQALIGDLWGGFAAMLVALPSSIAFGIAIYSVLGPQFVARGVRAGLIGAIVIGFIAPLFRGAPRLISAPCAPAAAVLSALAATLLAGKSAPSPESISALLLATAGLAGILQFLGGLLGGGNVIKYIPYPVVAGYLSGVGVLIFLSQAPNFLGLPKQTGLWDGLLSPALWQWPAIAVGAVTIVVMLLAPKITKAVPATILGLFSGLAAYFCIAFTRRPEMLRLEDNPLVVGSLGGNAMTLFSGITGSPHALAALHWSELAGLVVPAATLAILLSIDTLKTCVVLDTLTFSRHNSNRELLGQGAGNVLSALLGGMAGSGGMGPTLVNVQSGGRTSRSGVCEGLFVLAVVLVLGRWIAWIPIAALAGILIVVAVRMFDWDSFNLLRYRATVLDFGVVAAVIVVAVGYDLIAASATGLGLAILLFVREQTRTPVIRRLSRGNRVFSKQYRLPAEQEILERHGAQTAICELEGSLFFGTTDRLFTELEPDLAHCRYLILDMRRVRSVDYTAAHLLERFENILTQRDGFLIFTHLAANLPGRRNLQSYFAEIGVMKPRENVLNIETLDDALRWCEGRILAEYHSHPPDVNRLVSLQEMELFKPLPAGPVLAALAAGMKEVSFAAGDSILKTGHAGDKLLFIRRGAVRIVMRLEKGGHHNLASLGPGDFFGELAFLGEGTAHHRCRGRDRGAALRNRARRLRRHLPGASGHRDKNSEATRAHPGLPPPPRRRRTGDAPRALTRAEKAR